MKVFVVFVVFSVIFQTTSGSIWGWFTNDDDTETVLNAEEDVTAECLNLASWGQCAFYDCLERRFGCGDEGYTNRISKHFCTKIDENFNSFDDFGKLWLNRTSVCLINYMVPLYRQNQLMCSDIQAAGIEAILNCNEAIVEGQTFCDFLQTNGAAYNGLMGREEVMLMLSLREPRVFQTMVSDAVGCGVQRIGQTMRSLGSSVRELGGSMYNSVRNWFS